MNLLLSRCWWMLAVRGALALAFGVLALALPGITLIAIVALFSAYAILSGAAMIAGALRHRGGDNRWWVVLVIGLASFAIGAATLFYPGLTAIVFVLFLAAYALFTGILEIVLAVWLRKVIEREWMLALSGALSVLFGVAVLLVPMAGVLVFVWLVAFYALLSGVLLLSLAFRARAWQRHVPDARLLHAPGVAPM